MAAFWECNKLIENQLIDFIRIAVTYAGGITHVKCIVDFAGIHNVQTGVHGAPSHSPVSMAAQAHINAWAPDFGIQELSFVKLEKVQACGCKFGKNNGHGDDSYR